MYSLGKHIIARLAGGLRKSVKFTLVLHCRWRGKHVSTTLLMFVIAINLAQKIKNNYVLNTPLAF